MTSNIQITITEQKGDSTSHEESTQHISEDGRIKISKKGWVMRIILIASITTMMCDNLYSGIKHGDPLLFYSTLMPLHMLLVLSVGWFFFRSRAKGEIPESLVSIIIPIYNQEAMIKDVINAIYESTCRNLEVIAVNDGSKDGTKEILDNLSGKYPNLTIIHKENGGKRTAVTAGFRVTKGEFIVLIDSDSIIDKNAIAEFMKTFNSNPRVGGVVGCGKVWNAEKNLLTKFQDVWYDTAFNIHKTTESTFGCVLCCSGCLAAYRREAIANYIPYWSQSSTQFSDDRELTSFALATPWAKRKLAPFSKNLMESMAQYDDSEDRGLTAQTLVEWETVYVPTAIVYTDVPENLRTFIKQQIRWKKGYIRSNIFVSAFFWRKNPLMSLIFYLQFMRTFTAPLTIFIVYFYAPFILQDPWIPLTYFLTTLLVGLITGLDYKFRNSKSKNWIYKPLMNLFTSFVASWLIFPALWSYRRNSWLTR